MGKFFYILFSRKFTYRKWYHVIGWWEIRRIVFNTILLLCALISLIIFKFVLTCDINIIRPIIPIEFVLFANLFYTLGWAAELLVRLYDKYKSVSLGIKSFKIGLIVSIIITFIPIIIFSISREKTKESLSGPNSNYIVNKPNVTKAKLHKK
jgi:hypothetical protein